MFIKLTHGLHSIIKAIVSYIQKWTDNSVPDGTKTLHNFKDGQGKRPAIPLDEINASNNIINVKTDSKFENSKENLTNSENVFKVELKTELVYGNDDISSKTGIESTTCVPEPVIFEISNEVPEKIEKIIPIKTQALPGQDFIFQILYVKDYNYIEGDILPVFGSWGNYVRLSRDGKYLTVNSSADLTVRLILTPAPQDWIPELPDPGIIQQQGDRMLNTIPRDGSKAYYNIEKTEINDHFYTVSIENKATNFVTNSEFSNGKYYTVNVATKKITIPITFTEGFDENAIYWKCYDDPKSATPVTGSYPSKDYNEEFGPLPERYRKLQYIYTDNNAYMDLGIKLKTNYKCKALMNVSNRTDSSSIAIFGARNSTSTDWGYDDRTDGAYACYTRYYGYGTIGFQRGTKRAYTSNNINDIYGQLCWYYSTGTSFEVQKYDGTLIRRNTIAAAQNIDTDWNCYLFTVNDKGTPYGYGVRGNMYRFEMWDENDNLIMRLIPAKDLQTNYIGLYDIINNKFYANKRPMASFNGAAFYVWQKQLQTSDHNNILTLNDISPISDYNKEYTLPDNYYKLFGVYFSESYIDTNYKLKKDDRVEVIAKADNNTYSSYRVLFGARTGYTNSDSYFFFTRFNGSNYFCYGKNGGETTSSASVYDTIFKLVCTPTQATWYVGDVQKGQITRSGTPTDSTYTCWLGCGNNSNNVDSYNYCTIYSFKVFDKDNNLTLNLIPAIRKVDNEIGFYDTVSNTFLKRTGGNNLQARNILPIVKKQLVIDNITKDINIGIIKNPAFDEPFKLEEFEDLEHLKQIDEITYSYEITDSKIMDYFYVVSTTNQATDYVSVDAGYRTANLGNSASFTLTYKSGYDNYDISCTPDTTAKVTVNKAHYITYNELDIPADYTPVKGLKNNNNSNTYFKTGYIPKWDDKVVCYCSIQKENCPTYPCYVFGARTAVNNKSFVFYAHRSSDRYRMGYDRYCGEKDIREIIDNELMKITAGYNGCEVDFAYTKTKIDTICPLYRSFDYQDYNSEVTLPDNYEKLSCIMNKLDSKAYIDLGLKIKPNYKIESIIYTKSDNTKSNVVLFGSTSTTGVTIAERTATSFTYPMTFDANNNYWKNTNQQKNSTDSCMEFKMLVAGTLVLKITQSSERNYDYIKINKNNREIANTYGLDGSKTITLSNLVENDIIRIYYHKDGSAHGGSDTATVQILYDNNVLNADFIIGSETNTNTLYTKYNGTNCIALKQQKVKTNNNFVYNDTAKIKMDGSKITWWNFAGELVSEMEYESSTEEPSYNTYLFGLNENGEYRHFAGNADLYVYTFKLYDENDNLIYHLVPALNKTTNEYGLYDTETGTFFTNAGEDAFEGHEIEEIHYVGDDLDYEMYVFGCNQANTRHYGYYGNMYKFTIYNGKEQPVVNLVPVKRISDGVLGFYDTIRKMFITPASGAVTEAPEPTYKSSMVVTDIPSDTYVTIAKNNNARKNIYLEEGIEDDVFHQQIDQLDYNYEIKETSISDWFYTVKYINQASIRCSITGGIATYYNTPRVGSSTRFPVTYNIGYDYETINATATAGATAEIKESMKIVYNQVPDEYIKLYGLYNHNSSTYFEIPYIIKDNDSIKLYVKDEKYSDTYWIFGADYNSSTARVLCSKYDSGNNMYYQSGNTRINIAGPANEVLEIDCKPSEINYTTGYNDYHYTLSNTPVDCTGYLHVFGTRNYSSGHYSSFFGTIYKFTIYDDNGVRINLIPVKRKVDNALGFYDTIQDQFYLPSSGSVTEVPQPKMKGKIVISNISNDTDFTVTEKPFTSTINISDDVVTHSYNFEGCSLQDYWYYIELTNTTNGDVTFTGMNYGNCYIVRPGNDITLSCTYKAGRSSADFIVSEGTLTNNGITLTNLNSDKKITIMLNDYHDPKSDTEDDLNIFTNPDFSGYNQYRVVNGSDLMLSSYTFINSQIAAMTNRQIFEFNENELDILSFNPSNVPGNNIKSKIVTTDSNLSEVVQNVTIGGKLMYKHTVTLRNQIKLETGKVYMFKVRDNTDTGKLIAYAKDTGPSNLVNSNGEYTIVDDNVFFDWNEANKYIVQGNKTIYFELNGLKL